MSGNEDFLLIVDRDNTEVEPESPKPKSLEEFDEEEKKVRFKFI